MSEPSSQDGAVDVLRAPLAIEFPFARTTGPVIGAFFTGLAQHKVVGIKDARGNVVCPPVEYDPETASPLTELVEVGSEGVVESWSWVANPIDGQPFDRPFAWALVRLDGADTTLLHALDVAEPSAVAVGNRVRIRWADEPGDGIAAIACFEPIANG